MKRDASSGARRAATAAGRKTPTPDYLRALFDNVLDAVLVADDKRRYVDANRAACEILNLTRDQILQRRIDDLMPPEHRGAAEGQWRVFLHTGIQEGEIQLQRPDGGIVFLEYRARANFTPGLHLSVLRDITARRQMEEALRASEEKLRTVFRSIPDAVTITTLDEGLIVEANDRFLDGIGMKREEVIGRNAVELGLWSSPAERERVIAQVRAAGHVRNYEMRVRPRDGQPRTVLLSAERMDVGGRSHVLTIIRDITERKQAEESVAARAQRETALARLGQRALALPHPLRLMEEAGAAVAEVLEADLAGIFQFRPGQPFLPLMAGIGWNPGAAGTAALEASQDMVREVLASSEVVISEPAVLPPVLADYEIVSGVTVPIPGREAPLGLLGGYFRRERRFSRDEIQFLHAAAQTLGLLMQRAAAEERVQQQQLAIRQLSTPVLQVRPGLLIVPLVGLMDEPRAKQLMEQLLDAIRAERARAVVIDLTGVASVDQPVANSLARTVEAARLLGAHVIVTGLSREISHTLVEIGSDLSRLHTAGDLRHGIEAAGKLLESR